MSTLGTVGESVRLRCVRAAAMTARAVRRPGSTISLSKYGGLALFLLLLGSTCLTIWLVASTDTALVGQNAAASSKGVRRDPTHVVDAVSGPAHPLSRDMIVGAAPIHRASSSSVPAWNRAAQRLDGFRKRLFEASHHDHDMSLGTVARQQWDKVVRRHGNVSVVWRLPIGCDFSGFFVEVLGLLPGLVNLLPRFYLDIGHCEAAILNALEPRDRHLLTQLQHRSIDIVSRLATSGQPYVLIQHKVPGSPLMWASGNVLAHICRAMTETARLPALDGMEEARQDEVWVPTRWHVEVFRRGGIPPHKLFVIPEALDLTFFHPVQSPRPQRAQSGTDTFTFLAVAKWEPRKGFDVLLHAYWNEFAHEPPGAVTLVLRTYKPGWEPGPDDLNEQFADMAQRFHRKPMTDLPRVQWVRDDLSRHQLRDLYQRSDAFVLATRGEGWGLPVAEAMAMGLPTIATNFSGPTAYLTPATGFPVRYALNADGTAEPDMADLQRQMRFVYANRQAARKVGAAGQRFIAEHYTPEAVGGLVVHRLATILLRQPVTQPTMGGATIGIKRKPLRFD
eukprot:m.146052 g.146052  ORF g.146052 m.146052 type:complete len:563 (-) comp11640_c0_seq2:106-1794(-)